MKIRKILVFLSVCMNVMLICVLSINDLAKSNTEQHLQGNELEHYRLQNDIEYNQLFYGKWEIVDSILPTSGILPRKYSKYDENEGFIGWNLDYINSIIGESIIFTADYSEFLGGKYEYVYGPETYSHALFSGEQQIGWYCAKELELTGNYYSTVYIVLTEKSEIAILENPVNEVSITDLYLLFLKDNEIIYASNGVVMYRLERVE